MVNWSASVRAPVAGVAQRGVMMALIEFITVGQVGMADAAGLAGTAVVAWVVDGFFGVWAFTADATLMVVEKKRWVEGGWSLFIVHGCYGGTFCALGDRICEAGDCGDMISKEGVRQTS